jgi:outer membrane protein
MIRYRFPAPELRTPHPSLAACALLVALVILFCPAAALAEGKVGFIDPVRVLNESRLGKLARRDLARVKREKEKTLQRSQEKLAAMESGVPQPSGEGSPAPASPEAIAAQRERHNRLRSEISQDLDQESKSLLAVVVDRVDRILESLAKRKGFSIVLKDPNVVAFVDPQYDLTDDVVRILDQGK